MRRHSAPLLSFLMIFANFEAALALDSNLQPLPERPKSVSPGPKQVFRFNLSSEPSHADPARINSSESNYFLLSLHRGLYALSRTGQPIPEIAESCRPKSPKIYRCSLKKTAKWSDGKKISAHEFVESWRRLVLPTAKGLGVQILANIKGAVAVHSGSLPLSSLGIRAINSRQLEIFLEMEDSDFLAKLAHPALAVTRTGYELNRDAIKKTSKTVPVSGPYMIGDWSRSDRIRLSPNPYYSSIRPQRPPLKLIPDVEALIIEDDETAFNLYREGTLSLLRRLPTHYLKAWEKSSELHQIPVIRFDYIGFASDLKNQPHLRQALSKSLRFDELKRLYSALGTPGCPGINSDWMTSVPCQTFDLSAARLEFEKVPEEIKKQKFELAFSKMGGDDIQKGMEWVQAQWKTNLSFQVDLKPTEQSIFINQIRTSPPAVFRKGVGLDRASCLAALEIFQKGDPENYIQFENARYEEILQRLKKERAPLSLNSKKLCSEAIQILIDEAAIIPLGPIYFSILAKPSFQNWVLTPLNQLDLGQLSFRDPEPN